MNEHDENQTTSALTVPELDTEILKKESYEIINQIINEADVEKSKDLTYLFNVNQNKKTMVRVNKLNELLDVITDQAMARFTTRPDEMSNKELLDGLKTVQEMIERGQKQVTEVQEAPLIQINQQNNELNVGDTGTLNRESRERVKSAVLALLNAAQVQKSPSQEVLEEIVEDRKKTDE